MRRVVSLLCAAVCLFLSGSFVTHAREYQSAPYRGSPEFERVMQLVGVWEGTSDMGNEGGKVKVEYRIKPGGSALIETLSPGMDEEMVSI